MGNIIQAVGTFAKSITAEASSEGAAVPMRSHSCTSRAWKTRPSVHFYVAQSGRTRRGKERAIDRVINQVSYRYSLLMLIMGGGTHCNLIEVSVWCEAQFSICDCLERENAACRL